MKTSLTEPIFETFRDKSVVLEATEVDPYTRSESPILSAKVVDLYTLFEIFRWIPFGKFNKLPIASLMNTCWLSK
ncbi:hypothetical protein D3C71_857440 [compost metagenome]